jgi:hypothetical protein
MNRDVAVGGWRNSHPCAPCLDRTGVAPLVAGSLIPQDLKGWAGPTRVATPHAPRWPQVGAAQR